jgi:hypothetical protein
LKIGHRIQLPLRKNVHFITLLLLLLVEEKQDNVNRLKSNANSQMKNEFKIDVAGPLSQAWTKQ